MNLTVDANVWLAARDPHEPGYLESTRFLELALATKPNLMSPVLLPLEIASAAARKTRDEDRGLEAAREVESIPFHVWHAFDNGVATAARLLATRYFLRAADAVYAAVAITTASTLISLDQDLLTRAGAVIPALTPQGWLDSQQ